MSTSLLPGQPTALEAARQQLDELDALLDRMLALPVYQPEDDPPADFELAQWGDSPPAQDEEPVTDRISQEIPAEPRPTEFAAELPAEQNENEELAAVPDAEPPSALSVEFVNSPAPTAAELPTPPAVPVSHDASETPAGLETEPGEFEPLIAVPWPLLFIDRVFVRCLTPLSGPGRWLASDAGRAVLGTAGLALLAVALAWGLLDWLLWNW